MESAGFQVGPYFPNFPYFLTAALKRIQDTNERLQKCLKRRDEISSWRRKVMDEYSQRFSIQTSKKLNFCSLTSLG